MYWIWNKQHKTKMKALMKRGEPWTDKQSLPSVVTIYFKKKKNEKFHLIGKFWILNTVGELWFHRVLNSINLVDLWKTVIIFQNFRDCFGTNKCLHMTASCIGRPIILSRPRPIQDPTFPMSSVFHPEK